MINPTTASPLVLTAEHAGNAWPADLPPPDFPAGWQERHIAYDLGVGELVRALAEIMNCTALLGTYTRLLVDLNRLEDNADLIATHSDGYLLAGNQSLTLAEKQERIARFYRPYHQQLADVLVEKQNPCLLSIHSFTPQLATSPAPRPWQIGVLYHRPNLFSEGLLARLREDKALCVGDNQPYDLRTVSPGVLALHAEPQSWLNAELEIRADTVASAADIQTWAQKLAGIIESCL